MILGKNYVRISSTERETNKATIDTNRQEITVLQRTLHIQISVVSCSQTHALFLTHVATNYERLKFSARSSYAKSQVAIASPLEIPAQGKLTSLPSCAVTSSVAIIDQSQRSSTDHLHCVPLMSDRDDAVLPVESGYGSTRTRTYTPFMHRSQTN